MALTLVEAYKRSAANRDLIKSGVEKDLAINSPVLELLPFETIPGGAVTYSRYDKLPGIGFRGINEGFPESTGIINPITETLAIAGGDLDVDNFLIATRGENIREIEETAKLKALALNWTSTFFNGNSFLDPREPDGLKRRITGTQLISAGSTSGGDALSLLALDELVDAVDEPAEGEVKVLFMNKTMRRRLTASTRNSQVSGNITWDVDAFGRRIAQYNDAIIRVIGTDNEKNEILPFTEAGEGGGTAQCSSIYCCLFGMNQVAGFQNGDIDVRDLGELQTKPTLRTRVEWYAGWAIYNGMAAARLYGVKDAAVVA